jgi:hypothetical protein
VVSRIIDRSRPPPKPPNRSRRLLLAIGFAFASIIALAVVIGVIAAGDGDGDGGELGDPSRLDQAATLACDDFATGYKAAQTAQARADLADKVNKWAATSGTERIADMGAALGRAAGAGGQAWAVAADAFAAACTDAGWTAR